MSRKILLAVLAAALYVNGQERNSVFEFRNVVHPGTTIGGHALTQTTDIGSVALSETGEVAFLARTDGETDVFTTRRFVAKSGDTIDGKILMQLMTDSRIAINSSGKVAFESWYADTKEIAQGGEASGLGIFVDRHLVLTKTTENLHDAFTLSDDDEVILTSDKRTAAQKKTSLLDQIRIKPPRLPNGFPVSINPAQRKPPATKPQAAQLRDGLPFMRTNSAGQVLIPVNLIPQGFMLLLGTPSGK